MLFDLNAGKTQLVSFDWSNKASAIEVKMGGSILDEKPSFKILGLSFSSKLDRDSYIISIIAKFASKINWSFDSFYQVSMRFYVVALYL